MKKYYYLIIIMFCISLVSAFGETADFDETDGEYGSYSIESGWGILPEFLGGGDLAWVKLTENSDHCLIDCYAKGEGYFNEPQVFLDGLEFKNRLGEEEISLREVEIYVGQLEEVTKQKPIYREVCEEMPGNTTRQSYTNCYDKIIGYEDYTDEEMVIKEYEGQDIIGEFIWEIRAKKLPGISVDWIVTILGERLEEWAWWDTDWEFKRELTGLTGSISALQYITYDADMKTDFSDLRFIDSTETIELNYTIEDKLDSSWALVRVNNLGKNIFMYYSNSLATSNSDASKVYLEPLILYYFDKTTGNLIDEVGSNDLTEQGTVPSQVGFINNSRGVYSSSNYFGGSAITDWAIGTDIPFTVNMWVKLTSLGTAGGILDFQSADTTNDMHNTMEITAGNLARMYSGYRGQETLDFTNPNALSLNDWTMITFNNYQDRIMSICVNTNCSNSSSAHSSGSDQDANIIKIGTSFLGTHFTTGYIDETEFFINRVLSQEELNTLYNQTQPAFTTGEEESFIADVTLISPEDELQTTQTFQTFKCNASFDFNIANLTLILDGVNNFTNSTVGTSIDLTHSINLTQGNYKWSCLAETVAGLITQSENRTLIVHTVPLDLVIHNPEPVIDYHLLGTDLLLNWTITEGTENLTEHVKNCTYEYNEVITVLNNTICTKINQTNFEYILGVNSLVFNVTDEFDLVNSTTVSWNIKLTEIDQTYNNETTEGSMETLIATIRLGSGYSITGVVLFNYNGTSSIGQSFTTGDNTTLRKVDFLIPNVEADINTSFFWNITLSDSTQINLQTQNQTIYKLELDNCSSFTNKLLNLTVVDEETQILLPNATIEIAVNIYDKERTSIIFNISNIYKAVNPLGICLNRNITTGIFYSLDSTIRYEDTGSANEYYNIVNLSLTNGTGTQDITLYDLNITDSTEFQLTFTGADFLPVENALVNVDRQYISENTFKTVELPKTDFNGQSVLHLVRNDVIYNIRVIKDGEVLGNFENLVAFCDDFTIGDCNIELNALDSVEGVFDYDSDLGIIFQAPTYSATQDLVTFNFVTSDGSAKEVILEVTRNDIFGNRSVCNSSLISSGGTLTCEIDPNIDDSTLNTQVYVDGILSVKTSIQIETSNYGVGGYLIMFVMAISFILMFSGSKTGVLFSIGLTMATGIGLGLNSGNMIGVGASGIWLLVIIIIGIYKLNKDKQP